MNRFLFWVQFWNQESRALCWNSFLRQIHNFKILQSDWSKNFEIFSWKLFSENIQRILAILDALSPRSRKLESPYIIPEMMRSMWFWSQIWVNATKKKKKISGTSGYRKWSKPLPISTYALKVCLCLQKKFRWISCLRRPWWSAPILWLEKTRV